MDVTNKDRSEFEGGGVMPNTVFPKGEDALTASDKLRLQSITGQETDPRAAVNPYHWDGHAVPEPIEVSPETKEREKAIKDKGRYKETKLPY